MSTEPGSRRRGVAETTAAIERAAVDLVLELQELTGRKIKPEVFKGVRTVEDVVAVMVALEDGAPEGR